MKSLIIGLLLAVTSTWPAASAASTASAESAASRGPAIEAPKVEDHALETLTIEDLTEALTAFRLEASSPADRRAVLSLGDELTLVAPGVELPGLGWNRVVSIRPDGLVLALPDSKQAVLSADETGTVNVEWIDGNPPKMPPVDRPLIAFPATPRSGTLIRHSDVVGADRKEKP